MLTLYDECLIQEVLEVVNKAKKFLEDNVNKVHDTYSLAILAYALTLAESAEAGKVLAKVDERAIVAGWWSLLLWYKPFLRFETVLIVA